MFHTGHTCLQNDARNNVHYASSLRSVPPQGVQIVESSDISMQSKMAACKKIQTVSLSSPHASGSEGAVTMSN